MPYKIFSPVSSMQCMGLGLILKSLIHNWLLCMVLEKFTGHFYACDQPILPLLFVKKCTNTCTHRHILRWTYVDEHTQMHRRSHVAHIHSHTDSHAESVRNKHSHNDSYTSIDTHKHNQVHTNKCKHRDYTSKCTHMQIYTQPASYKETYTNRNGHVHICLWKCKTFLVPFDILFPVSKTMY